MTVVFYSTNSNVFCGEDFEIFISPSRQSLWDELCSKYDNIDFIVATQLPAMFLCDVKDNRIVTSSSRVRFEILNGTDVPSLAEQIANLKPDVAIAASFWVRPYDWLGLNDSMIGEKLSSMGIKTVCHPSYSQMLCYDKWRTHQSFSDWGFTVANAQYVHHEMYWSERGNKDLKSNVYKNYILSEIANMKYPVVVKPTCGLSSYSMVTAVSYKQAVACLNSGKTKTDCLVEEYIEGVQAGCEIYGSNGHYYVTDPFLFSVDKWGITSPKQSVKIGPVSENSSKDDFCIKQLKTELVHLAEKLHLCGIAQVDLIFSRGKWYIIEVNPRMSGMTETYGVLYGLSPMELLLCAAGLLPKKIQQNHNVVCNFKIPLQTSDVLEKLSREPSVCYVHQLHNIAAKQLRERGYTEIILAGKDSDSILFALSNIEQLIPGSIDETFLQSAKDLLEMV